MSKTELERRAQVLSTPEEVDGFLREHSECALFKAGSCHRTDAALDVVGPVLDRRPDLAVGLIRVTEARPASQRVAELTGVKHASPQILLIQGGQVAHARDNYAISAEALDEALSRPRDPSC
jgi:bacillithiol system protein YtxJ